MLQSIALTLTNVSPQVAELVAGARESALITDGLAIAEQCFKVATTSGTERDRAISGYLLCHFLYRTGDRARAIVAGERALPLLISEGLRDEHTAILRWISFAASDSSQFSLAIRYANMSYELAQQSGVLRNRVLALGQLGFCFERSGDPWQGERLLRASLPLARELGEVTPLMACLNNLSVVLMGKYYAMHDTDAEDEAQLALRMSLPLIREVLSLTPPVPEPYNVTCSEANLGETLVHLGEHVEAVQVLKKASATAHKHGFVAISLRIRCTFSELRLARGEFVAAAEEFEALLKEEIVLSEFETSQRVHYGLYRAHRGAGNLSAALVALEAFRRAERACTLNQLKARSEFMMMRVEAAQNQRQGVAQAYDIAREQASRANELERLAHQDELTGLGNRRMFDVNFPEMVKAAREAVEPLAVVMLDLDFFKNVNDVLGHAMGDRVLLQVAELLRTHTRPGDLLVRAGGEEFVLGLRGIGAEAAMVVCERLRLSISEFHWAALSPGLALTVSAGIACAPEYDMSTLIERADFAMYRAKRAGRNRVVVAT